MLDVMPVEEDVLGFTNRWYRIADVGFPRYGLCQ